ncbi:MAG: aminotransferase class V-fold PLP-dependent enzyme [SAR202 cluster bacterium]|jgi:uncharacterized pyridoxal phosphate-dependent enzyme|nr:aminotransferase class V-fold PLP-dependent enzyme [SAR202 cluster bacterium]|tara:strand:+ start:14701 stop:15840 length:1140 start_codon:yes stop_codon:yes gene_type:complete
MTHEIDPNSIYQDIGVTPVINAAGPITMFGGTKLRPEVHSAMNAASQTMIDLHQLNDKAGEILASYAGAEAGMVTSGSAGALILQAAAVVAGSDKKKMRKLPNTEGMRNEIIIHNIHRFPYDQCYTAVGAKLIGVGDFLRCLPWELEGAINENTAAIAYLDAPFVSRNAMPLKEVVEIAHAHDLPVIVDAATMIPPRSNFTKYIDQGADLVLYSGGKGIRGPQGTGIMVGRKDLIQAARDNASPNQFIGRGLKVSKEEIIGLLQSVELLMATDEDEETAIFRDLSQMVVDALIELPGLEVSIEHDYKNYLIPTAVFRFTKDWNGPSRDTVLDRMKQGETPVYLYWLCGPDTLAVDPLNVDQDEMRVVISRLLEELTKKN